MVTVDLSTADAHRFQVLDSWRGVCALLVVFYHFRIVSHFSALALVAHGDVAVDFFFVLSGFVLAHAYGARIRHRAELTKFVIRRVGRLYPLHFVTLAILIVVELCHLSLEKAVGHVVYRPAFEGPTSFQALAANLALLHGLGLFHTFSWNVPSWSISVELYVSILFALLAATRRADMLFLTLCVAAFCIRLVLWLNRIWPYEGDLALIRGLAGFFLGVQVFAIFKRMPPAAKNMCRYAEIFFPLAFMAVVWLEDHGIGFLDPFIFGALVFVFSVQAGPISSIMRNPILQYLGRISYSIYMIHYLIIMVVFGAVSVKGGMLGLSLRSAKASVVIDAGSPWKGDIIQLGFVALVVACASISYVLVELRGRLLFDKMASGCALRFKVA